MAFLLGVHRLLSASMDLFHVQRLSHRGEKKNPGLAPWPLSSSPQSSCAFGNTSDWVPGEARERGGFARESPAGRPRLGSGARGGYGRRRRARSHLLARPHTCARSHPRAPRSAPTRTHKHARMHARSAPRAPMHTHARTHASALTTRSHARTRARAPTHPGTHPYTLHCHQGF